MPDKQENVVVESKKWSMQKLVIGALITIALSIGGSLYTNAQLAGQEKEKVSQLEAKVATLESKRDSDIILLTKISTKVENIESILQKMQDKK
jgi:uncharacterized membrane protein YgcG